VGSRPIDRRRGATLFRPQDKPPASFQEVAERAWPLPTLPEELLLAEGRQSWSASTRAVDSVRRRQPVYLGPHVRQRSLPRGGQAVRPTTVHRHRLGGSRLLQDRTRPARVFSWLSPDYTRRRRRVPGNWLPRMRRHYAAQRVGQGPKRPATACDQVRVTAMRSSSAGWSQSLGRHESLLRLRRGSLVTTAAGGRSCPASQRASVIRWPHDKGIQGAPRTAIDDQRRARRRRKRPPT